MSVHKTDGLSGKSKREERFWKISAIRQEVTVADTEVMML